MMDKIVVFKYEDVRRLADCINSIQVSGFENAKLISMAPNIFYHCRKIKQSYPK